ncbi:MAG: LacI family DNA-binding transcriptional regulator [Verrucomicrobiota bacterium]
MVPKNPQPRLKDIAESLGLHKSTVSLALNGSPKIADDTRDKILAAAKAMGYFPDPTAQKLAHMRQNKVQKSLIPLAWLNLDPFQDYWHRFHAQNEYFSGAHERANQLGYYLDEHWIHSEGMNFKRLVGILKSRGIEGVIIPLYFHANEDLHQELFEEFSVVTLAHVPRTRYFDHVRPDFCYNMLLVTEQLKRDGIKRIGLVIKDGFDATTNGYSSAMYLYYQQSIPIKDRIPPCFVSLNNQNLPKKIREYRDYIEKWKPEVIISRDYPAVEIIEKAGFKVPDDLQLVHLQVTEENSSFAGIREQARVIGASAVDWIVQKIQHTQEDSINHPKEILVKGVWQDGFTYLGSGSS